MKKQYELTIIADPDMDYRESNDKIETVINKYECEIEQKWHDGKKRLAYPINNKEIGIYVSYNINMPEENANKLSKELDDMENVIRYLLVRVMK